MWDVYVRMCMCVSIRRQLSCCASVLADLQASGHFSYFCLSCARVTDAR